MVIGMQARETKLEEFETMANGLADRTGNCGVWLNGGRLAAGTV